MVFSFRQKNLKYSLIFAHGTSPNDLLKKTSKRDFGFVTGPIFLLPVDVFLKHVTKCQLTARLKRIHQSVRKNQSQGGLNLYPVEAQNRLVRVV